jgi:hypothetical protein
MCSYSKFGSSVMKRHSLVTLCLLACVRAPLFGEPIFYLSANPIGVATRPEPDDTLFVQPGAEGILNLFVMTDVLLDNIGLDVLTTGGAIEFTGAIVFNDVNHPSGPRWSFTRQGIVQADQITTIGGAAVLGFGANGIGPGSPDPGLDPTSGYLLATLDYVATANRGATSELFMQVGVNLITDGPVRLGGPNHEAVPGDVAGATDNLLDFRIRVIPEPGSIALAILEWLGVETFGYRRRSN